MLLNFTIENWMSYRDEVSLCLTSSLERQHAETLAKLPGFRSRKALPITAVYGGNASGKTGLFKALRALKTMVVDDIGVDGMLPLEPFLLEAGSTLNPTVFDITFLADETVYRFVVEATLGGVKYESLEIIREKGSIDIYERDTEAKKPLTINDRFFEESDHVDYVAKGTRKNQLFLSAAMAQNVLELSGAYRWFSDTLELVSVGSHAWSFATAAGSREGFIEFASETLARLDTGIVGLTSESADMDALPKDGELRKRITELEKDEVITVVMEKETGDYDFDMLTVLPGEIRPIVQRLRTLHNGPDGQEHSFGLGMESSGTQRLMGLLPMLSDLSGSGGAAGSKVYVVDELDRCLHTMLSKRLLEDFLANCGSDTRKQLLFTTHDLLLMDQSLMRRDEMYITQRGTNGCSELVSLSEFNGIRFDKDLIRSYLDGRFGGIPMFGEASMHG